MCQDDVVARVVFAAATGSGRAGETEFEDHVGGCVGALERVICIGRAIISNGRLEVAVGVLLQFAGSEVCVRVSGSCDRI